MASKMPWKLIIPNLGSPAKRKKVGENWRTTYGSRRLKLRPLHPFVGLDATNATRIPITTTQTELKAKKEKEKID